MGGPRLEIFKFAIYVTFPIAFMYWAGVPEWYERFVKPIRHRYVIEGRDQQDRMPKTKEELDKYLQDLEQQRRVK